MSKTAHRYGFGGQVTRRILVVGDHELVRKRIRSVLAAEPSLTICAEAVNGLEAVEKAKEFRPDLIVMDIGVPGLNGLEASREIKRLFPQTGIVFVGQHDSPEAVREALSAIGGAYVRESAIATDLVAVIGSVIGRLNGHKPAAEGSGSANSGSNPRPQEIPSGSNSIENALRHSEERFRAAMNSLAEGLYTIDAQGLVTYVNPAAEAMFGWTSAELIGKKMHDVTHYKHLDGTPFPAADCPGLQVLQKGTELREHQDAFIRKDGSFFPVVFSASPMKLSDTIFGVVVCFRDDSKRRESEETLRLRAAIVDSSDDAIISKNLDGVITSWNRGATRMFGYSAEEAVGRNITLIIPEDRRHEETRILEQVRRGEKIDHFDTVRVRKNGTTLDISLTISPIKDSAGRVVGASKVARDITDRMQAERALRESEERFRAIVETSPECVKLVTREGALLHMNSSGLAMVGAVSAETVVGKNIYDLIAQYDRDRFREFNERICDGTKGSLEFDIVALNGARRHMEAHAAPLRMPDGVVVQLAVARDISERTQTEEELRRSEERLRTLAQDLEFQVQVRTKELKERNIEILRQSEQLRELSNRLLQTQDEERRRIARELHDGVGQLLAALHMNLSNLTSEKTKLSLEAVRSLDQSVDIAGQASQEIRTISHLLHPPLLDEVGLESALGWYVDGFAERSKINVGMSVSPGFSDGLPRELALALFRIVQECLTNVHRHSGSATARVEIHRSPDEITLRVEDEGSGIPPEIRSKISSGESSGVGLRGMRERVRQFGGRLEIHSDDQGTQMFVVFPLPKFAPMETHGEFQDADRAHVGETMEKSGRHPATILCIDDESAGLLPRKMLLESAGYRVVEARSGEEGIGIFRSEKIDAVVLDYWMSGMKGTAVAFELKRINPAVPIIVLSGVSELPGEAAGLVDQWLVKGSHRAEKLLDSIGALLERRPV